MDKNFLKIKEFLLELEYEIKVEDEKESLFVVEKEEAGINNLIIDCEGEILIIEQFLFELNTDNLEVFKGLLMKNRDIIHGAFAIDDSGKKILFRDTLQLENIDMNELQGTLNSLEMLLSEFAHELIEYSKK